MAKAQNESSDIIICAYQADINYPGNKLFDCGNAVINTYVRNSLKKSVKDGNCAVKALINAETGELLGICTFSAYSLQKSRVAGVVAGSLPSEIGVVRMIMLGVAAKEQNQGYGQDLLLAFFEQIKVIHQALPVRGVYLDAAPEAINFYIRLGFVPLNEPVNTFGAVPMFLAIQHILAA